MFEDFTESYARRCLKTILCQSKVRVSGKAEQEIFRSLLSRAEKYLSAAGTNLSEEHSEIKALLLLLCFQWNSFLDEFFSRLNQDVTSLLRQRKSARGPFEITEFKAGINDMHHDGRVAVVVSLNEFKTFVYKPKPLSSARAYFKICDSMNQWGLKHKLHIRLVYPKGEHYGWEAFIPQVETGSQADGERYYYRMGCHLYLLRILRGRDFHTENWGCYLDHPIVYDLEGLLHPLMTISLPSTLSEQEIAYIQSSPLKTGLLPSYAWRDKKFYPTGKEPLFANAFWRQADPRKKSSFCGPFCEGYANASQCINRLPENLFEESIVGPLQNIPVRFFASDTRYYVHLLRKSLSTESLLKPGGRREILSQVYTKCSQFKELIPLANEEFRSLAAFNIPYFSARSTLKHLFSHSSLLQTDFFKSEPIHYLALENRKKWSEQLPQDLDLIKGSFEAMEQIPLVEKRDPIE